jgi:hypothetical protein
MRNDAAAASVRPAPIPDIRVGRFDGCNGVRFSFRKWLEADQTE